MMSTDWTDWINIWTVFAVIAIPSFLIFYLWKRFCYNENGYIFEKDALRVGLRIPFQQIESVELIPAGARSFFKILSLAFVSCQSISRLTGSRVIIERKGRVMFKYVIFTPKDPEEFIQKLRERAKQDFLQIDFQNC